MLNYTNPNLILDTSEENTGEVAWRSPSNLAIVKYWGKHGIQLPRNPSISFTLNNAFTEMLMTYQSKEEDTEDIELDFLFDGEPNEKFKQKIHTFLDSLSEIFPFLKQLKINIESANSFPHSTGIASSASSMSALALCLCTIEDQLFGTLSEDEDFTKKASYIARLGSGSACRSIFGTMALWGETPLVPGSSDEFAIPLTSLHEVFRSFHDDVLIVSKAEKSVSSRAGHGLMNNNIFAPVRYEQARQRTALLLSALQTGDLEIFGKIAEDEALTLHGLMMTSDPSYMLMQPNSLQIMQHVRAFRQETGLPLFFSLDAGPNVHLLYPEEHIPIIRPFVDEELANFCENRSYLPDWVGDGPEEL